MTKFRSSGADAGGGGVNDPRPVRFVTLPDAPHYAVYDVETGLYLAGLLTEERRVQYCEMAGFRVVEELDAV